MANIIDVIGKIIKPYKRTGLIVFLIVIFILISYYCYSNYYSKQNNKFRDVANSNQNTPEVVVNFFFATWCPHCKKALPEWTKFSEEYNGKQIGQNKIRCVQFDCTNDDDSKTAKIINEFKIESYPTVKMMKDNNQIVFDAKITKYNLEQFVQSVCG
jgi:thiol-disulfide isomerase/thioredoxin